MNKYLKLGISIDDMRRVTNELQALLNVEFEERESSYWGEYYLANVSANESIKLTFNFVDDDWQEEEYKEYPLLLVLNRLEAPEKIMEILCGKLSYITPLYLEEVEARVYTKKYVYQDGKFHLVDEY